MRLSEHDKEVFTKLLNASENRLIDLVLGYADRQAYTRYTSTLKEAWRLSIEGLSRAMTEMLDRSDLVPELGPDDDFSSDPAAEFGTREAARHRSRGVSLSMFLGLMKYYRQSYLDLLRESQGFDRLEVAELLVNRFYDRCELAYCNEWMETGSEAQIRELSNSNLQLANEKNKYLTLFESLSSPVLLCDENGKVDNYNDAAGRLLLGSTTPGSRYYAEDRHDLVPPQLGDEFVRLQKEGVDCLEVEKSYQTPDGEKTYDIKIERMLDVSHKFTGFTVLFNDITDRLSWARQLQEINGRQQQLILDLQRTRQQLVQSEKMAAIGQLASGIAHEINTPIQYVGENIHFFQEAFETLSEMVGIQREMMSAAESGTLDQHLVAGIKSKLVDLDLDFLLQEIPAAIDQSRQGVDKVSTIVSAMKEFARPGTKEKVDTDINAAIMNTLSVAANEWKYHAEIETDLDAGLPPVPVVPGEMNQAFLNIIVNAAKAVAEAVENGLIQGKGRISIQTRRHDDWVVIVIRDTGAGIADEIRPRIFDPFFTTREVGQGTGQGLTFAYLAIVKKHAGKIEVQSEEGMGTIFEIRLPIEPAVNEAAEREFWRRSGSDLKPTG
ncbi:MAG: ATP-binding protein [Candidatus Thiodiazotropha sp.]